MTPPITQLLSVLLYRTILVGTVLLVLKFTYEGAYLAAGVLALTLAVFVYLAFGEARWLE